MQLIATKYIILRDVPVSGLKKTPVEKKPIRVVSLLDDRFEKSKGVMMHNHNVFFEDRIHDWYWDKKTHSLSYYTRIFPDKGDIALIYEETRRDLTEEEIAIMYPNRKLKDSEPSL